MDSGIINNVTSEVISSLNTKSDNTKHFVLKGGAGSGKTYALNEIIDAILEKDKNAKIACITYTNKAKDNMSDRFSYSNVYIETIHGFCWGAIKDFIKEIILFCKDSEVFSTIDGIDNINFIEYDITSSNYRSKIRENSLILSHDDMLKVFQGMIFKYKNLSKIISDTYSYVFVDEYQDTHKEVIHTLLDVISPNSMNNKFVVGLFGDPIQSIYTREGNERSEDLSSYQRTGKLKVFEKNDNHRCSIAVIELINKIRSEINNLKEYDNIRQKPVKEKGRYKNRKGSITFYYSNSEIDIRSLKDRPIFKEKFSHIDNFTEFYVTNRILSGEAGFYDILEPYRMARRPDSILKVDSLDFFGSSLYTIIEGIRIFKEKRYSDFITKFNIKVHTISDKKIISNKMKDFLQFLNGSSSVKLKDLILYLNQSLNLGKFKISQDDLDDFLLDPVNNSIVTPILCNATYEDANSWYDYINENSLFSTHHRTKGLEYKNVIVSLETGRFPGYDFDLGLANDNSVDINTRIQSLKLFYVSCSRVEDNLIVLAERPSEKLLDKMKIWFGNENIVEL